MHKFDPQHMERLLSEDRLKELDPGKLLREAGLKEGDIFADIGCGPGFFTLQSSAIVGLHGIVFAVDTQREMLIQLRDRKNLPQNIVLLLSEEDNIPIGDFEADLALLAYVLHETEHKEVFLKEVKRILKVGGKLLLLDWKKQKEEKGPPEEERLPEEEVLRLLKGAGFTEIAGESLNQSHYKITAVKA